MHISVTHTQHRYTHKISVIDRHRQAYTHTYMYALYSLTAKPNSQITYTHTDPLLTFSLFINVFLIYLPAVCVCVCVFTTCVQLPLCRLQRHLPKDKTSYCTSHRLTICELVTVQSLVVCDDCVMCLVKTTHRCK